MVFSEINQILWPITTAAVAYIVKSYFVHKLRLQEERCKSELRAREEKEKITAEASKTVALQRSEVALRDDQVLKKLMLEQWSQISAAVRAVQTPQDSDPKMVIDKFCCEIDRLRSQFTQINLFLPPAITSAFASFFSHSAI
jgi:hypothetical protein